MRVKAGDKTYSSEDQPIMVILTDEDKQNIAQMLPECSRYATFQNDWGSVEAMKDWMTDPACAVCGVDPSDCECESNCGVDHTVELTQSEGKKQ